MSGSPRLSPGVRTDVVWLVTSVLTVVAAVLAATLSRHHVNPSTAEALVVLGIAAVKARLVLQEFMEVRSAPTWLRHGTDGWLVVLWLTVLVLFLV